MMDVFIDFPSTTTVQARSKNLLVQVGLPPDRGGDPDAYGPFDMLLCGLGTCTGSAVRDFLLERGMPIAEAGMRITAGRSPTTHLLENVVIELLVPAGFPEKYNEAIIRAAKTCPVKDQLGLVPEFRVVRN
jgi:ribosomal protein S12 methylthiotransferase accessory factor